MLFRLRDSIEIEPLFPDPQWAPDGKTILTLAQAADVHRQSPEALEALWLMRWGRYAKSETYARQVREAEDGLKPYLPALTREAIDVAARLAQIGAELGQAEAATTGDLSNQFEEAADHVSKAINELWGAARYCLSPMCFSLRLAEVAAAEQNGDDGSEPGEEVRP